MKIYTIQNANGEFWDDDLGKWTDLARATLWVSVGAAMRVARRSPDGEVVAVHTTVETLDDEDRAALEAWYVEEATRKLLPEELEAVRRAARRGVASD